MYGYGPAFELVALLAIPLLTLLGGPEDEPDDERSDERSQLHWLRSLGDREALFQIMEGNKQVTRGLEAAEALAELGDVRGLDHLIAALNNSSSSIRRQSAQILEGLNHPRGLRALKDRSEGSGATATAPGQAPQPGAFSRGPRPEQLYSDLNGRGTDELVAIWYEDDRSQWSGEAFEVLESILTERLGRIPRRDEQARSRGAEDVDESVDPRVQQLWKTGDVGGLTRLFDAESDVARQLEVAEALAELGDENALDLLIEALDHPDQRVSEMAAELLDWLDLPGGNAALQDHGFEFETDAAIMFGETELQPRPASQETKVSAPPRDSWAVDRKLPAAQAAAALPAWQQGEAPDRISPAIVLTGGMGGLLGLLIFNLGLYFLGMLPPLEASGAWLRITLLYYLVPSMAAGAAFGTVGSRVARAMAGRLGWETGEGDLVPVFGALVEGATSALVVDVVLLMILKP